MRERGAAKTDSEKRDDAYAELIRLGTRRVARETFLFVTPGLVTGGVFAGVVFLAAAANEDYFDAAAQVIPVLLLALALEQGFFRAGRKSRFRIPDWLSEREEKSLRVLIRVHELNMKTYSGVVAATMAAGELAAVYALASKSADDSIVLLAFSAAAIAGGLTAIVVLAFTGADAPSGEVA